MEISVDSFCERLQRELEKKPHISDPGIEPGKVYVTQRQNKLLVKTQDEARKLKDEYVSVKHILLAFIDEGSSRPAGKVLQEFNITRDSLLKTLTAVRGHQRVTNADPEGTYEALQKYGWDLVQESRKGKLDPVIGRDGEIRRVIQEEVTEEKITEVACWFIAESAYDPVYGARPLRRYIQRELETRIGWALIAGDIPEGNVIGVNLKDNEIDVSHYNPD